MDGLLLAATDIEVPIVLFSMIGVVAVFGIVFDTVQKVLVTRQREMTKRELAAYVAEGTMTPQDAERIIRAGKGSKQDKA